MLHWLTVTADEVSTTDPPWQNVVGPPGVIVATGKGFIITSVDTDGAVHPFSSVTITEYVPDAAIVTLLIDGFWRLDENPAGPVQLYIVPPPENRLRVDPAHCGELLPIITVGKGLTVTVVGTDDAEHPLASVTVTE